MAATMTAPAGASLYDHAASASRASARLNLTGWRRCVCVVVGGGRVLYWASPQREGDQIEDVAARLEALDAVAVGRGELSFTQYREVTSLKPPGAAPATPAASAGAAPGAGARTVVLATASRAPKRVFAAVDDKMAEASPGLEVILGRLRTMFTTPQIVRVEVRSLPGAGRSEHTLTAAAR
jgi:hypothetical protein